MSEKDIFSGTPAHIINLIANWKFGSGRIAAVGSADGLIDIDKMQLQKQGIIRFVIVIGILEHNGVNSSSCTNNSILTSSQSMRHTWNYSVQSGSSNRLRDLYKMPNNTPAFRRVMQATGRKSAAKQNICAIKNSENPRNCFRGR